MAATTGGQACSICTNEHADAINAELIAGTKFAKIAVKFNVGADSVRRHNANHMGDKLVALRKANTEDKHRSALSRLEELYDRTNVLLAQAEHSGTVGASLQAVRELRTTLESIAKITGELNEKPTVTINLAASPEWLQLQGLILAALMPFPDARLAVADAIDIIGEIEP